MRTHGVCVHGDYGGFTFVWVKLHAPCAFPCCESVHILRESCYICLVSDLTEYYWVIGDELAGVVDHTWEIIDEQQE